jgi:hypothetical protein
VRMGIKSRSEVDSDMYSASVVDNAISDCNLEDQRMGQPAKVITYPDLDLTLHGSSEVLNVQAPAKSAST